jgi:hypothetical protein
MNDCTLADSVCGDGRLALGEECDDGAANSDTTPNACRSNCSTSRCGDSIQDVTEQCDPPGPIISPDGFRVMGQCSPFCTFSYSELPLAQLQPLILQRGPVGDTGPAAIAVVAAGIAGGWGYLNRKRRG